MTDDAAGHLRAAADDLNDAHTSLLRASDEAEVGAIVALIDQHDEMVDDLEETLRTLAMNAEVVEDQNVSESAETGQ